MSLLLPSKRRLAQVVLLWVYGLATTVLLVSLWGRAVVSNPGTLTGAAATAAGSEVVADRLWGWVAEAVAETASLPIPVIRDAFRAAADRPEVAATMEVAIEAVVRAAMAPPGQEALVDLGGLLAPAAGPVSEELAARGVQVDAATVRGVLGRLPPLQVAGQATPTPVSAAYRALTVATVVALAVMAVTGGSAIGLAEDRRTMVRSLLTRIAVAGLSFVVMLRVGAWVLDPDGGRYPLREAAAVVVGSNLGWPLAVAASAAAGAGALWWRQRARLEAALRALRARVPVGAGIRRPR
ncbi:MAG: hypothetical protein ACRDVM_04670 [Acidimicrobiia bacterium]